jgi:hypothetical protein
MKQNSKRGVRLEVPLFVETETELIIANPAGRQNPRRFAPTASFIHEKR